MAAAKRIVADGCDLISLVFIGHSFGNISLGEANVVFDYGSITDSSVIVGDFNGVVAGDIICEAVDHEIVGH